MVQIGGQVTRQSEQYDLHMPTFGDFFYEKTNTFGNDIGKKMLHKPPTYVMHGAKFDVRSEQFFPSFILRVDVVHSFNDEH